MDGVTLSGDIEVDGLLRQMREQGAKAFEEMSVPEARRSAWDFVALQGDPEEVARVDHRFFPGPTADIPVRIYYPDELSSPAPCLVYFHGSGWVIANIEITDTTCRSIANRAGCVVVSVNYQKAPEHRFPVAVDDAFAAVEWVVENSAELGIDSAKVGVIGDSAGGNLAAVTALRFRDESSVRLRCQILIYPVTDADTEKESYLRNAEGYLLQKASMDWYFGHYLRNQDDGNDPRVSPLRAPSLAGVCPAFVVTAGLDPLCDDGRMYAERLSASGVEVDHRHFPDAIHAFFWMQGTLAVARELHDEVGRQVRRMMAS